LETKKEATYAKEPKAKHTSLQRGISFHPKNAPKKHPRLPHSRRYNSSVKIHVVKKATFHSFPSEIETPTPTPRPP
jgi:hypothetical protein